MSRKLKVVETFYFTDSLERLCVAATILIPKSFFQYCANKIGFKTFRTGRKSTRRKSFARPKKMRLVYADKFSLLGSHDDEIGVTRW